MTEKIIIDGVDVAGCRHYKNNGKCRIPHYQQSIKYVSCNCNEWDCDYKQLKRLEQENNTLQAQLNNVTVQSNNAITALEQENRELKAENETLKQALDKGPLAQKALVTGYSSYKKQANELYEVLNSYKQALEEIRVIADDTFKVCDDDCGNARKIKLIIDKINEMIGE